MGAVLIPLTANAAPGRSSALTVHVEGDAAHEAVIAAVLNAVRAQFTELRVTIKVEPTDGPSPPPIPDVVERGTEDVWIDVRDPNELRVFVVDPEGRRALVRRVRVDRGIENVAYEEAAVVLRSTAGAVLARVTPPLEPPPRTLPESASLPGAASVPSAQGSVTLAEPPSVHQENAASSSRSEPRASEATTKLERRSRALFGISYVGTVFSSPGGWQSGAALAGRYLAPFGGYLGAGYDLLSSLRVTSNGVALDLARHPAALDVGYQRTVYARWVPEAGVAFVVDPVTRTTAGSSASSFHASPETTRVIFAVAPRARVAFAPLSHVSISAGGGADFVVNHFTYVAAPDLPVVTPLLVRPRVELGVEVLFP